MPISGGDIYLLYSLYGQLLWMVVVYFYVELLVSQYFWGYALLQSHEVDPKQTRQ